jgi:hypothetical protein
MHSPSSVGGTSPGQVIVSVAAIAQNKEDRWHAVSVLILMSLLSNFMPSTIEESLDMNFLFLN